MNIFKRKKEIKKFNGYAMPEEPKRQEIMVLGKIIGEAVACKMVSDTGLCCYDFVPRKDFFLNNYKFSLGEFYFDFKFGRAYYYDESVGINWRYFFN